MNILLATHHLQQPGGTEVHTLTLYKALKRMGHNVYAMAMEIDDFSDHFPGMVYGLPPKGKTFDVPFIVDAILANHAPVANILLDGIKAGKITMADGAPFIQTVHGTAEIERPAKGRGIYPVQHRYISRELEVHYVADPGSVVRHPIDHRMPAPHTADVPDSRILSLCQGDIANELLQGYADAHGADLVIINKHKNPIYPLDNYFRWATHVVGIGRSAVEGMLWCKPTLIMDSREYQGLMIDGWVTCIDDYLAYAPRNWSGRTKMGYEMPTLEFPNQYDHSDPLAARISPLHDPENVLMRDYDIPFAHPKNGTS